jgi:hypothetical protein
MNKAEISRIVDESSGLLLMAGADQSIFIPNSVVGFEEVKATLSSWRAFDPPPQNWSVLATELAPMLVLLGCWYASGSLPTRAGRMVVAAIALLCAGYIVPKTRRNPVLTAKQKRVLVIAIGFLALGTVARVCLDAWLS